MHWLLLATAWAGHLEAGARIQVSVADADVSGPNSAGLGAWAGWNLTERLRAEGVLDLGAAGREGQWSGAWGVRGELRWYATSAWAGRGALSLTGGLGLLGRGGSHPVASAGAALDLAPRGAWSPRLSARYFVAADGGLALAGLQLGLGFAWGRPADPPRVALAEPPPPPLPSPLPLPDAPDALLAVTEPVPDLLETRPRDTPVRVWIPHPFCEWVDEAEAEALLAQVEEVQQVRVESPGYLPAHVDLDPTDDQPAAVELTPAPAQGSVLVVANRGDLVEASGFSIPASQDGLVVFNAPAGPVEVTVRGGGREVLLRGAVTNGYALWMRVDLPDEVRVLFDVGSSRLRPLARESIQALADQAGGYRFQLQGSYSPEGDYTFNQRLAHARAVAVTNALVEAGVPAEHIYSVPPPAEQAEGDAKEQRSCLVTPVEAVAPEAQGAAEDLRNQESLPDFVPEQPAADPESPPVVDPPEVPR